METLPLELLERVLLHLPLRMLIPCRRVCVRWRDAVQNLKVRDAAHAFHCGADVERVCRATWFAHEVLWGGATSHVPCTCGRPFDLWRTFLPATNRDEHEQDELEQDEHEQDEHEQDEHEQDELEQDEHHDGSFHGRTFQDNTAFDLATAATCLSGRYAMRHAEPLPPARWEVLARERALARTMAQLGARLWEDALSLDDVLEGPGDWMPAWVFLPDEVRRPTTEAELKLLVLDLICHGAEEEAAALFERLSDDHTAREYYARAEGEWQETRQHYLDLLASYNYLLPENDDEKFVEEAWRDLWRLQDVPQGVLDRAREPEVPSLSNLFSPLEHALPLFREAPWQIGKTDVSRWGRLQWLVRKAAAAVQLGLRKNWRTTVDAALSGGRPWGAMTDDEIQAALERAVAAVDDAKGAFAALCTLPVVVRFGYNLYWMGGLSPAGHLVGTLTAYCPFDGN